ncbi:MAG: gliding motility-associated C-terminal domain-containing protein [Saprospiraceae bacterium]
MSVAGGITATSDTIVVAPPAIASAVSINNVTCNGGMNGAINQTPSGGTPPYSYKWAGNPALPGGNPTTQNLANLKLGIYTLTITDSKGCTFVTPPPGINVTQPSAIMVNDNLVNVAHVACKGGATGSITLPNPSGGTGSHTFVWSNMKTTLNNPNIAAGTYTITVSDANLCTKTFSYTVNEPSLPLSITQSGTPTKVSCFGSNNGTGAVSVSGGTPNYLISWRLNNPTGQVVDTGFTADKLFPGTYVPVVTDDKGCTAALGSPITIIGPSAPITASSSSQNVKCFGANNGSITLTPTGGNSAPFTIAWTGGLTGSPISNLAPGTYTPTVTDAGGCTAIMGPVTITSPQALTFPDTTITPQDGMTLGSITIVTPINGGTSPFTFSWSGPGGFSAATQNITGLLAGVYTVTITDANNCTLVGTVEVPSTNLLIGASVSPVQASCNDDGCMTINIPPAAAEPILITLNCASLPSRTYFPDKDTFQICNLPACVYQVTISDASGNTFTIPAINVAQLQQAIVGDSRTEPFDDLKNGQIKLNPVPSNANLTYKWNYNGLIGNTISNLDSGTYIVTVTNVTSGCTAVYTYHLPRTYQTFSCNILSITPTTCIDADKGAVAISVQGGDGPTYTYAWSGPGGYTAATKDIANLLPGTYTCTVTDESLVPRTCPVAVVTSQSQIAVTNVNVTTNYNGFDVSGASVCDGGATVVFSGQVGNTTVAWSNSGTGPSNSTLCAGAYTITVTDQLGCTATWGGTLTAPTTVVGSYTILSDYNGYAVSCNDECDGSASVSAVGGVPPYRIAWSTQQVDANVPLGGFSQANNLCGGDYTVTITDKNNVVTVFTVTIDEPDPLIIQFASVPPENFGRCDGEVIADVPAGVGNLTFTWSTNLGKNGTGARADDLCPGEQVMFVVIDANGCTANGTVQMAYPDDGCLQVRPAITPASADGNNDYVLITCIEDYPDNTFEIYNRWGQLVDVITGYNNGDRRWEGLRNGLLLPEGAYFFVLKFLDKDGVAQQIKGSVTLIR